MYLNDALTFFFSNASTQKERTEAAQLGSLFGLCYGISYLLIFCAPLLAGTRFSKCPELRVPAATQIASVSGITLTLLAIVMNLVPITEVPHPWVYALKVGLTVAGLNAAGAALYWRGTRAADASVTKPSMRRDSV